MDSKFDDANMKQILFLALFVFSNNAIAEWVNYANMGNGDVHFYDNTRLQKKGDEIELWNRVRFKSSLMGASSYQSYLKIDCAGRYQTTLQSTFFSDKNWTTPAMATNTKPKPKKKIEAYSAVEQLASDLC